MDTQVAKKDTRKKTGDIGVYMNSLLSRKIHVPFKKVGKNIKELLQNKIKRDIEGKCTIEGFIKPDSTRVLTYSSGVLFEDVIEFGKQLGKRLIITRGEKGSVAIKNEEIIECQSNLIYKL